MTRFTKLHALDIIGAQSRVKSDVSSLKLLFRFLRFNGGLFHGWSLFAAADVVMIDGRRVGVINDALGRSHVGFVGFAVWTAISP